MNKSRLLGALAIGAAACALSGCAIISDTASQPNLIGGPTVTTSLCVIGNPTAPSHCGDTTLPIAASWQILVAYEVPNDAVAPSTITGTGDRTDTFSLSQSYTD